MNNLGANNSQDCFLYMDDSYFSIMDLLKSKIVLGILIGVVAFSATILSYFFSQFVVLILTVQGIFLTMLYSIGTMSIEHKMRKENEETLNEIYERASSLNERYFKTREALAKLKQKVRNGRDKDG